MGLVSKCGTTNGGGELSRRSRGRRAVAAQTGLLGGREGTHQCARSRLTEKLVNCGTVAKRVAH